MPDLNRFLTVRKVKDKFRGAWPQRQGQPLDQQTQQQFGAPTTTPSSSYAIPALSASDICRPIEIDGVSIHPATASNSHAGIHEYGNQHYGSYRPGQTLPITYEQEFAERHIRAAEESCRLEERRVFNERKEHEEAERREFERRRREQEEAREQRRLARQSASAQSIRRVRGLVREKYSLDLAIWGYRDVMENDKELVKQKYTKSDVLFEEICNVINGWDKSFFEDEESRLVVQMIQDGIAKTRKNYILWTDLPPWDRQDDDDDDDELFEWGRRN